MEQLRTTAFAPFIPEVRGCSNGWEQIVLLIGPPIIERHEAWEENSCDERERPNKPSVQFRCLQRIKHADAHAETHKQTSRVRRIRHGVRIRVGVQEAVGGENAYHDEESHPVIYQAFVV